MLYQDYKFEMMPIIVGALELKANLEKLNFNEKEVKRITRKLGYISLRICESHENFMGFKM